MGAGAAIRGTANLFPVGLLMLPKVEEELEDEEEDITQKKEDKTRVILINKCNHFSRIRISIQNVEGE